MGNVEFRLLGMFEASVDGKQLEISSPKLRVLIAVLLLQSQHPVPADDIINALWGDVQPAHPRRGLQLYVTRLRQVLATHGLTGLISTVPGGYQLEVSPEHVDVGRFRQHLERAARLNEAGEVDAEAAALRDAMGQWSGEPLAGLPSELLQREVVPRLREQWLQAVDRRFDLELRQGRHGELISELFTLTARYPLRESLWAHLIAALHQSGRRAEALAAYHSARRHLVEELGVDPGTELQELYATVLFDASRTPPGGRAAVPMPRQLPAEVSAFVGRSAELSHLDDLLEAHSRPGSPTTVGVITGTPGIGKTALAVHWARRVADHFPDGQMWINLQGFSAGQAITAGQALTRFLRGLDVQDAEIPLILDDQVALYRSLLDGRRMLIVLDNAGSAEQVRPLLPGAPGCLVLVTSRSQLSGLVATGGAHPIMVEMLTPREAEQLLAGRIGADRVRRQATATEDIIRSCAGLPLALGIVAARAVTRPEFGLDSLAAELRNAHGSLDAFAVVDRAVEVRGVFSWSYQALTAPSARLFRLLGLHPGPDISAAAAADLAGLLEEETRPLLAELCDAHLTTEPSPGRYACHDLLRAYATELGRRLDDPAERYEAQLRMYDHYMQTAYEGCRLFQAWEPIPPPASGAPATSPSIKDHREALSWFTVEHHVLLALVREAVDAGFPEFARRLALSLGEYLYRRGHWHDWAETSQIALDAVSGVAERATLARLHRELVRAYARLGRIDAATIHGRLALELATQVGDKVGLAITHRVLAILEEARGRVPRELEHDLQALRLYEEAGDQLGQARALNSVGWCYARLNEPRATLGYCMRALRLMIAVGDRRGIAATWDSVGFAQLLLGRFRQAIASHRRAIDGLRDLGDRYKEAECLSHLGDAYAAAGDLDSARATWREALSIFRSINHRDADALQAKLRSAAA